MKAKNVERNSLRPLVVNGIPGSSGSVEKKKNTTKKSNKGTGKCKICGLIWESKEDLAYRKENGQRKTTWIGCDAKKCTFWAHATCACLLLIPKKKVEHHKYLCDEHK